MKFKDNQKLHIKNTFEEKLKSTFITKLSREGYIVNRAHFPNQYIDEEIIKPLTIVADSNGYGNSKGFYVYHYTQNREKHIVIPRHFGFELFGKPQIEEFVFHQRNTQLKFTGKLKDEQKEPVDKTIEVLNTNTGGILCLPCGYGKTVCALKIIATLKVPTLVIVNRTELMRQWAEEAKKYISNVRIGKIQKKINTSDNADITIAMINTISLRNFTPEFFSKFDFLVVDECHTIASQVFSQCLPKIITPWTLGLSATPDRADGCFHILEKFLGPIHYRLKYKINKSWLPIQVYRTQIVYKEDKDKNQNEENNPNKNEKSEMSIKEQYEKELIIDFNQKANVSEMLNNIAKNPVRTQLIVSLIMKVLSQKNNPDSEPRKILVLSDRKSLLTTLNKLLPEGMSALYTGSQTALELKEAASKQVLLGTYQICGTGFNLPEINTLLMATPKKSIEQAIGRILRKKHNINPQVIDIIDNFSVFKYMAKTRNNYYNDNNFIRIKSLD